MNTNQLEQHQAAVLTLSEHMRFFNFLDQQVDEGELTADERRVVMDEFATITSRVGGDAEDEAMKTSVLRHAVFAMRRKLSELHPGLAAKFEQPRER